MSEVPQKPDQIKPDQNKPHLRLVHSVSPSEMEQIETTAKEKFLAGAILGDSYSDDYLDDRLNYLKSTGLNRIKINNMASDQQPSHILKVIFDDLHITETEDHQTVINQLMSESKAYMEATQSDTDALIQLREEIGTALFETYADTNLVRLLEKIRQDSQLKGDGFVEAYRLAGLMLVMAEKKYS